MNEYTRPKGVMGGPCSHCGLSQPEHVGLTCEQARAKRSLVTREASTRSSHVATMNTVKDHLQQMIFSAEVFVDAEGVVVAYKIRTGALHKLIGFLELTVPVNLPEAKPYLDTLPLVDKLLAAHTALVHAAHDYRMSNDFDSAQCCSTAALHVRSLRNDAIHNATRP